MESFEYSNVQHIRKISNYLKKSLIKWNIYKECSRNIKNQKIEIEYNLAITIWGEGHNINCILYVNLVNNMVLTVFSIKNCLKEKRKSLSLFVYYVLQFQIRSYFYNVLENINGKMLLKVYKNQILEPVVKLWLLEGRYFMMKENDTMNMEKFIIKILFEQYEREKTILNTFLIRFFFQIFLLLKIVGCFPNNTWQNIRIEMIILPKS